MVSISQTGLVEAVTVWQDSVMIWICLILWLSATS